MDQIYANVQEIETEKVDIENGVNPRRVYDDESIEELATSIQAFGQQEPITIVSSGPGRYLVKDGQRRLAAFRHLAQKEPKKYKTVRAVVLDVDAHDGKILLDNLLDVHFRMPITPVDQGLALRELVNRGKTEIELANYFGKQVRWVKDLLRIADEAERTDKELLAQMTKKDALVLAHIEAPSEKKEELAKGIKDLPQRQRTKALRAFERAIERNQDTPVPAIIEEAKSIRGGGLVTVKIRLPQLTYDFYEQQCKQFTQKMKPADYLSFVLQQNVQMLSLAQGAFGPRPTEA